MVDQSDPRRELASTYIVQDRSNQEEMTRLQIQDQMVTSMMGGVLPEQSDHTIFQHVLDVGCGTGGWLIEAAKTYPTMSLLIGADISAKMLRYARAQAEEQQVNDRVEFAVMDALRMLEFPDDFFDLVTHRFAMGWIRTWDWAKLLDEYLRVCKPGGVIRVTEGEVGLEGNCPTLTRIHECLIGAFYQSGHFFTPTRNDIITQLASLLKQHGVQDIQTRSYILEYRAGTPETQRYYEDAKLLFRTIPPFLCKWGHMPDNYETLCQQALAELEDPNFVGKGELRTVWGTKSRRDLYHYHLRVP